MSARQSNAQPGIPLEVEVDARRGRERIVVRGRAPGVPEGVTVRALLRTRDDLVAIRETVAGSGRFEIEFRRFHRPLFPGRYQLRIELDAASGASSRVAALELDVRPDEQVEDVFDAIDQMESTVAAIRAAARDGRPVDPPRFEDAWLASPFRDARWLLRDLTGSPWAASGGRDGVAIEEGLEGVVLFLWQEALSILPGLAGEEALARRIADAATDWLPPCPPGRDLASETERVAWTLARTLPDRHRALLDLARETGSRPPAEREEEWKRSSRAWLLAILEDHLAARRQAHHPALVDIEFTIADLVGLWRSLGARLGLLESDPSAPSDDLVLARLDSMARSHGSDRRLDTLLAREFAAAAEMLEQGARARGQRLWRALAWASQPAVVDAAPATARRLVAVLSQLVLDDGAASPAHSVPPSLVYRELRELMG